MLYVLFIFIHKELDGIVNDRGSCVKSPRMDITNVQFYPANLWSPAGGSFEPPPPPPWLRACKGMCLRIKLRNTASQWQGLPRDSYSRSWASIGGGGTGGHVPPPHEFSRGDIISNVPPPPRFWGCMIINLNEDPIYHREPALCGLFFFFCLSARILSKIRCGNNVARHTVCAEKITAIPIGMHWLRIRNLYWRGV